MRDLGVVVLVVLAGLALVAIAVFAAADRSVLVPPPDAVSESFVRQLGMGRYELARRYLATEVRGQTSAAQLEENFAPLRAQTGEPDQVVTREVFRSGQEARVLTTLNGRRSNAAMYIDLVREDALWKVSAWPPDVVGR